MAFIERLQIQKTITMPSAAPERVWLPAWGLRAHDISSWTFEQMLKEALKLYRSNPLAFRIIETTKNFVAGSDLIIEAEDSRVYEILYEHWNDPMNEWPIKWPERVKDLCLHGELILTATVHNHRVIIGSIHPTHVEQLELDAYNQEIIRKIKFKQSINLPQSPTALPLEWEVINYNPKTRRLEGELFFFKINSISAASRGMSDLMPMMFWLAGLDDVMYKEINRLMFLLSWYWDMTLPGATEVEIERFISEGKAQPPEPGGVKVHSDAVKIEPVAPKFTQEDISPLIRIFKNYVLGGAGLPEHFFAEAGTATRAAAEPMHEPTFRALTARQNEVKRMLHKVFTFVLDQSDLPQNIDRRFRLHLPRVSFRDLQRSGGALFRTTQGLRLAREMGLLSDDEARRIFLGLIDQLNLGLDVHRPPEAKEERTWT